MTNVKIYIDTCVISYWAERTEITEESIRILDQLKEFDYSIVCTSSETLKEIQNKKDPLIENLGLEKFISLSKIPIADKWIYTPAIFRVAKFGKTHFGNTKGLIDPIFIHLSKWFPGKSDQIHLMSAIKSHCTHFLTEDYKTIINLISNNLTLSDKKLLGSFIKIIDTKELKGILVLPNI
jgi:hypothetical protein